MRAFDLMKFKKAFEKYRSGHISNRFYTHFTKIRRTAQALNCFSPFFYIIDTLGQPIASAPRISFISSTN
jgi:hypothetical protein